MRNLLGRLHARDDAEIARIASFWRVRLPGTNRHMSVGTLYRMMTDIRTIRAAWDWLSPEQQEVVRLLAVVEDARAAPTLAQLADWLGLDEAETRELAVQLYRIGILAREGDDQPLPVGAAPKLFLPRELALLFRRLLDDIDAGDVSKVPLAALLERLDDGEIEIAAERWGLKVIPGIRNRDDLGRRLMRQIGTPGGVERIVSKLPPDAARTWQAVRDASDGVPLAEVAAAVGLGADDPRTIQRWRAALDELETTLLVWHTYGPDGTRWLFVPAQIRHPAPPAPTVLPPLQPVLTPAGESSPQRHPHALAWDFLTLLRELSDPVLPPWPASGEHPRARRRRLNHRFWIRDRELPPDGYVECLLSLALAEGLVREDDSEENGLHVTPAVRGWRERSFSAQTERLRWWWVASTSWIEGQAREEMEVWGADWPPARRNLLAALTDPVIGLEPDAWYDLDSVTARISAHLPGLLGSSFTAATARLANGSDDDTTARLATIAEVIAIELTTMFAWLGLVEVRPGPGDTRVLRVVPEVAVAPPRPAPDLSVPEHAGPPLTVSPAGAIELRDATPLRVWSLSAFADPEVLGEASIYRLTETSIQRALASGFDLGQVTAFLERQAGEPLPDEVVAQLEVWTTGYGRVRVQPAIMLTPDDAPAVERLRELVTAAGWVVLAAEHGSLVIRRGTERESAVEAELLTLLRANGYAPLASTPHPIPG